VRNRARLSVHQSCGVNAALAWTAKFASPLSPVDLQAASVAGDVRVGVPVDSESTSGR
jgi:hypothetical protein